jgi:alkanesulfonate monooxygenase SsuD/methylene tetrahydromethanopterin reductase-like flavin-dependent oxidoreductase (luciferase family)
MRAGPEASSARFAYWPGGHTRLRDVLELTAVAADAGFGAVYMSDHVLATVPPASRPVTELWTALAAVASRHPLLDVGALVACIEFRPPIVTYRAAASLAEITAGRVRVGLGAGWFRSEYLAFGFRFPDHPVRLEQLEEYAAVASILVGGAPLDYEGRHFRLSLGSTRLAPLSGKVELFVGGQSGPIVRLAERLALPRNAWVDPTRLLERSPRTVPESAQFLIVPGDAGNVNPLEVRRHPSLHGSWGEIGRVCRALFDAGVRELVVPDFHFDDLRDRRALLTSFGRHVVAGAG